MKPKFQDHSPEEYRVESFNRRVNVGDPVTYEKADGRETYRVTRTVARMRGQIGIVFLVGMPGPCRLARCKKGWRNAPPC